MPWRLNEEEEKRFWKRQEVSSGEDLGLGRPPPGIRLQEAGRRLPRTRGSLARQRGVADAAPGARSYGCGWRRAGAGGRERSGGGGGGGQLED